MDAIKGMGVALVTPFNKDGSVDYSALAKIVDYNIENGTDYLVVLGTTGESATLSIDEQEEVKKTIEKANRNRIPLVLGIGGNDTASVARKVQSTDLSSYVAVLSVSPYYNKPTQEGLYQHFKHIAEACPKPVILYNVPGRTAKNMEPKTVARLAQDCSNIVAIKEAAGDMVQALELLRIVPKDFLVISGDDMITLPMIQAGGAGVISVIGEGFPKAFSDMVRYALNGQQKEALDIHYAIMPLIDLIFKEGNPAGIKAVFEQLNLCNDTVRLPLVSATKDLKKDIALAMASFTGI
ncbi:MAG: 4-hydroxy-tetrahydrodipicolinate synthase [Bacteroidetes bacterium]|jgi:4-hydroxy-tetrahydrodipicolinate synthase|nr:4-hydroxy-tetrahydrodipicolinate synthase [Bacteroidota bacterium]MDA0878789.1 4-hydroxy-tetrahydrodipicolinate synthase [Bacteroidota bacterium]MDA1115223.1 4-hydroxy-tetrahydrodipicolinate synthase [Bacteroidota bacterium]